MVELRWKGRAVFGTCFGVHRLLRIIERRERGGAYFKDRRVGQCPFLSPFQASGGLSLGLKMSPASGVNSSVRADSGELGMGPRNKSTHLTGALAPAWVLTLHWYVLCQEVHLESLGLGTRFPTGLTKIPAGPIH